MRDFLSYSPLGGYQEKKKETAVSPVPFTAQTEQLILSFLFLPVASPAA